MPPLQKRTTALLFVEEAVDLLHGQQHHAVRRRGTDEARREAAVEALDAALLPEQLRVTGRAHDKHIV